MPNVTDSVYYAFKHILETYDGIGAGSISYGNLGSYRDYWRIGRQLTERKKSSEYIQELARQSFIGVFPTRKGFRGLSAWRDNITAVATHDEAVIIEGSISRFEKTPIENVFNDFTVNYDYNPGLKKFNRQLFVAKADESAFPAFIACTGADTDRSANFDNCTVGTLTGETKEYAEITWTTDQSAWITLGQALTFVDGSGKTIYFGKIISTRGAGTQVTIEFENTCGITSSIYNTVTTLKQHTTTIPTWTTFVGGLTDYTTAKDWWTICRNSYIQNLTLNPMPKELSDCHWFIDNADFDLGDQDAAYHYMNEMVSWCTRQKYTVEYSIALSASALTLELLDPIYFKDAIYTNAASLLGWITKIKINPDRDTMTIEAILEPADIEGLNLIIETGSQADTITESGSQTNTYAEGAQ